MENKKSNIRVTEIFVAKAGFGLKGFDRRFYGTINREKLENGKYVVRGKIHVKDDIHNGYIYSMAGNQWTLGDNLDALVIMILDKGLHDNKGVFIKRYGFEYHLN